MTYVMSDIHGCYDQYMAMLREIEFKKSDELFVLGDVVDRGKEPVKVLEDMMMRENVFPIMGNHEIFAIDNLSKLLVEITEDNYTSHIDSQYLQSLQLWFDNGGGTTLDCFAKLPMEERGYVFEYLHEFSLYEIVEVAGRTYVLSHAGVPDGASLEKLQGNNDYDAYDFIMARMDYNKQYFDGSVFLVTGHTPTAHIAPPEFKGKIYRNGNNIAIDTGAVFGRKLGCLCLDTDEEFYV